MVVAMPNSIPGSSSGGEEPNETAESGRSGGGEECNVGDDARGVGLERRCGW